MAISHTRGTATGYPSTAIGPESAPAGRPAAPVYG